MTGVQTCALPIYKYFATLKRAAELNTKDPGVYMNLGVEYASRKDTARAIEYNERAITLDPRQEKAHANLGILYASKKEYLTAQKHFTTAISLGMREPVVYRYAGDVCAMLDQYDKALQYYNAYLERMPNDERVRKVRDRVRESMSSVQKP